MALFQVHCFSNAIRQNITMNVILPQPNTAAQIGVEGARPSGDGGHKLLLLLHGLSDDHSIWLRRTSIERYVAARDVAVVMPSVHRSFYRNIVERDELFFDFVADEVPALVRSFFPISERREDSVVAGLSMGGYGAYKVALTFPERFVGAASLSGALFSEPEISASDYFAFFNGPDGFDSADDVYALAGKLSQRHACEDDVPLPRLYQCCGSEDFLINQNRSFRDFIEPLPFEHVYEEEPGAHEWGYWDVKIQRVLEWFDL